nr:hypothetical protein [Corynebacterium rouxii]
MWALAGPFTRTGYARRKPLPYAAQPTATADTPS